MTTGDISSQSVILISSHAMWDWTSNHVTKLGNSIQLHNVTFQSTYGYTCAIQFKNHLTGPLPTASSVLGTTLYSPKWSDWHWMSYISNMHADWPNHGLSVRFCHSRHRLPISSGLNMYHSLLVCVTSEHKSSEGFMRLKLGRTRTSTFDHIPHQLLPQ